MKRITREHVTSVFSAMQAPVAEIEPGEAVLFETLDAVRGLIRTHAQALTTTISRDQGNPATGPVYVRGAAPGDTLAVRIVDIQLGDLGYGRIKKGNGVIIDELQPPVAVMASVQGNVISFGEKLRFRSRPMVGVIGTAPAGEPVFSFFPGPHGGNLDVNDIGIGATVFLPVAVPGALLALGDVHAYMGDGELTGGGLDINADVTVEVSVRHGLGWRRPVVETSDAWSVCANAPTLAGAVRLATSEMATLLAHRLGMSREEAFILIGAVGDARIGQAAELQNLDATAYLRVPKEIVPSLL